MTTKNTTKRKASAPAANGTGVPPVAPAAPNDLDAQVAESAEQMIEKCSEVRVRINWFGTSSKVDDETKTDMLAGTGASRKAISISKRLLSCKHPALQAVKDLRRDIDNHVSGWTIPMMALKGVSADDGEGLTRKDAGIRLIQKKDIKEFDERLQYLTRVLRTAAETLQQKMPEILERDRERLGSMFKAADYPEDITRLVGVEVSYKPVGVDIDWKTLCPEVYEREQAAAKQKFEAVVENAAVEFAGRFVKYVKQVCDQLGNRLRLNPVPGHEQQKAEVPEGDGVVEKTLNIKEAEVLTVLKHGDDETIPENHVRLQVRLFKEADQKGRSTDVWLAEPLPMATYLDKLRPYSTEERKKLYDSTVDNLKQELEAFLHVGDLLGPYKAVVEDGVTKVKELLRKGSDGLNTEEITRQLKAGDFFRNELKGAMESVVGIVERQMTQTRSMRRTVSRRLTGKV